MKSVKLQIKIKNIYFTFFVVVFSFSLLVFRPAPAEAARLFFETDQKELVLGQLFSVELLLNPQDEPVNAVEAELLFSEHLVLEKVDYGNSVISLWARTPLLGRDDKKVSFSGVIPGGFRGLLSSSWSGYRPGPIMILSFIPRRTGRATVDFGSAKVLLHDGRGTPAPLTTAGLELTIGDSGSSFQVPDEAADREPPEPFTPAVSRSDYIFGGRWFISFVAQDKQSGVAHFAMQENRKQKIENKKWKIVESPYLLRDQGLQSFIYVKAVDQNGNERVAVVPPRYPRAWYERGVLWSIIIILGALGAFWLFRRRSEKDKAQNAKNATQN